MLVVSELEKALTRSLEEVLPSALEEGFKHVLPCTSKAGNKIAKEFGESITKMIAEPLGVRMANAAAENYGFKADPKLVEIFTKYRKTHNQAVFEAYTPEMKAARHAHIITGLPDAYSRGRIIGDYRRIALYGIDYLINEKLEAREKMTDVMSADVIRVREEVADQVAALKAMKTMAAAYGFDISQPAANAKEAIQ
mgnify:CR=1 FL=1